MGIALSEYYVSCFCSHTPFTCEHPPMTSTTFPVILRWATAWFPQLERTACCHDLAGSTTLWKVAELRPSSSNEEFTLQRIVIGQKPVLIPSLHKQMRSENEGSGTVPACQWRNRLKRARFPVLHPVFAASLLVGLCLQKHRRRVPFPTCSVVPAVQVIGKGRRMSNVRQPLQMLASRAQGGISPSPPAGSLRDRWGHGQTPPGQHLEDITDTRSWVQNPALMSHPQSARAKRRVCTQTWLCHYPFNWWYFRSLVG